jgi:C4-dicarboxylate-specific signal transduction histidine kinase
MPAKRTILITDDDERILETLSRNLTLEGHQVVTARNGQEAIECYKRERPDIVLVDVRMPKINGFEVLARLRALNEGAEVILVTGHGDIQMTIDALRAGASDFISKPVDHETLTAGLARADKRLQLRERLHAAQTARERYAAELKASNQELRQTQARLLREENLALLGSLAVALTHEIYNPLSTITTIADLTKLLPEATDAIRGRMDTIEEQVNRIQTVIQRITDIPKPTPDQSTLVDIDDVVKAALETTYAPRMLDCCDVVLDFTPDLPPIRGHSEQLRQVFSNIILNADEAMQKNPPDKPRTLVIRTEYAKSSGSDTPVVRIRLSDTGPGIPKDELDRAFDPNYTTKTINGEIQGLGLGLLAARGVVETHGGQMTLENRPTGKGLVVTISLPTQGKMDERES